VVTVSWVPVGDLATIEMRVRDVGTGATPLVGPYSRYGWDHPGPFLFWLLAGPYRLLGSRSSALMVVALLVAVASVVGAVLLLRRRGGGALALVGALVLALLARGLGGDFLVDAWNPYVTLLPFVALTVACWSVALGDRWCLLVAGVLATFCVQSHVGYGPVVAAVVLVGTGFAVADVVRGGEGAARAWTRVVGVTAAACTLLWLAPVADQLWGDGNLGALVEFATDERDTVGLADGYDLVAVQLGLEPPWLTGDETVSPFSGGVVVTGTPVPVGFVLLVAGGALALRRRDRDTFRLAAIVAAADVAGVVAMSRVVGEPLEYLVRWTWALGALTWLAVVWSGWRALEGRVEARVARAAAVAAAAATAVLAGLVLAGVWGAGGPASGTGHAVALEAVAAQVEERLPQGCGPLFVTSEPAFNAAIVTAGLVVQLEHQGERVYVPRSSSTFGDRRARGALDATCELHVASDDAADRLATAPGANVLAEHDTLSPDVRRRFETARARFLAAVEGPATEENRRIATERLEELRRITGGRDATHVAVLLVELDPAAP
jgi:hypothetical protein